MYIENFIQTNEIINRNFNYKPLIINKTSRWRKSSNETSINKYLRSQERERSSCLNDSFKNWLSKEERRVDALALRADERRDKLR